MATPGQVANDMAAHAAFWAKRDRGVERACRDAERAIRTLIEGRRLDGRTYYGLDRRLRDLEMSWMAEECRGFPDFGRARETLRKLFGEAKLK